MYKNIDSAQIRQNVAIESAKIILSLKITDYHLAKKRAAKNLHINLYKKDIIPSNKEVQQQINRLSYLYQNLNNNAKKIPIADKYQIYNMLLLPLEDISKGNHPQGDILYHSLQVFELARKWYDYDIEFLEAALLHDIGQGIDPQQHAEAGAYAVENFVSDRTFFLIRYHSDMNLLRKNKLGHKQKVFLKNHEFYEDLVELSKMDEKGRESGIAIPSLEEAIFVISELEKI